MVDGRLLRTDKQFRHLKQRQRETISQWLYEGYRCCWLKAGHEPLPRDTGKIVAAVMEAMEEYYEAFLQEQNLSAMVEEYNQKLVSLNRRVRVLDPAGGYEGQCVGITSTGELRVKKDDRSVVSVVSGEVSVRGVYGYV